MVVKETPQNPDMHGKACTEAAFDDVWVEVTEANEVDPASLRRKLYGQCRRISKASQTRTKRNPQYRIFILDESFSPQLSWVGLVQKIDGLLEAE